MADIISNISVCRNAGILEERNGRSESLSFRKYNLIYGFNGAGKSTLSRLFSSLEFGERHTKLPKDCAFEISLSDGTTYGIPANPKGLERRVTVFNSDFAENNFQWVHGKARPIFLIGKDQADAHKELGNIENHILELQGRFATAKTSEQHALKALTAFKRDRAKLTADRLNLGGRKYEAPQLTKDYEQWPAADTPVISVDALRTAEDLRRASEPMAPIPEIQFDSTTVPAAFRFIRDMCVQSLGTVALKEVENYPDALLWIKQGHELHTKHDLSVCLLCGNQLTPERRDVLRIALDTTIDQFIDRLSKTSSKLNFVLDILSELRDHSPRADSLYSNQIDQYKSQRADFDEKLKETLRVLRLLREILDQKIAAPASPVDISHLPEANEIETINDQLSASVSSLNVMIAEHNKTVNGFKQAKEEAEITIRKHFIGACRADFDINVNAVSEAIKSRETIERTLAEAQTKAENLRQAIRTHGPAAEAINKLVKSYLGHGELTIHPIEEGYEVRRHGAVIEGLPSEGEKTAISIAYFLSTIEADGKAFKDAIVVVDDPVSSLDTKALNFACSLIRTRLSGVSQLFVLTHNQQCMNEFRKAWKKGAELRDGKQPTTSLHFLDVKIAQDSSKRSSKIIPLPTLLREYDSEYHFLFGQVLRFRNAGEEHFEHGYMMPNVLRRVLDVFLAFRCPGNSGLTGKIDQLCKAHPELDRDRIVALERLTQVESHSDSLDDLISFSSMTIEETRDAANALIVMMDHVDKSHLAALTKLCK